MSSSYYDLAKEILTRAYPHRVKWLDSPKRAYDEDTQPIWGRMTKDERGWYVLFSLVEFGHDWAALAAISPNPEIATKYHKVYNDRRNSHNRDVATISRWDKWVAMLQERQDARDSQVTGVSNKSRYSARDIPTELEFRVNPDRLSSDLVRDRETKKPRREHDTTGVPRFAPYTKEPPPVKCISPEEYLRTTKRP